jgi:hypothetical protein
MRLFLGDAETETTHDALSSFQLPEIDSHTFLVPTHASEPWAGPVLIEFAPYSEGVTNLWWLNLDDFSSELAALANQTLRAWARG